MPTGSPILLIVEDDQDILETLADVFRAKGMNVTTADNGLDGLDALRGGLQPDILFIDYMMPGMDGLEVVTVAKDESLLDQAAVVFMTANTRLLTSKALPSGAHILSKPFAIEDVFQVIADIEGNG